jgi:hypothetical protein
MVDFHVSFYLYKKRLDYHFRKYFKLLIQILFLGPKKRWLNIKLSSTHSAGSAELQKALMQLSTGARCATHDGRLRVRPVRWLKIRRLIFSQ